MFEMELFTTELTKIKDLSESLTKNCELLQSEVNLLNKLLFWEQKFSDHLLNDLIVLYEKNLDNGLRKEQYFNVWNQLVKQKSIVKQNEIQVKIIRQELQSWRQNNSRLNNNIQKSEDSCSSGTDPMTVVKDQTSKKITESRSTGTHTAVSSETQTSTVIREVRPDIRPELNSASVSVKLEVIPKCEPEEVCVATEETLTASEGNDSPPEREETDPDCIIIEGVEPNPSSSVETSQPFLLFSEYLTKNKSFSHYLDQNKEESKEDKTIAIDLNSDSDTETNVANSSRRKAPNKPPAPQPYSIFEDDIVDLTPKETTLKKSPKKSPKKSFIKKRLRFGKKKRILRNSPKSIEISELNTFSASISDNEPKNRVIGSKRKKIHFNPDNTISIIELRGSHVKKALKSEDTLNLSPVLPKNKSNPALKGRTEKARDNELYIKSTKKIAIIGKFYYCRWGKCSYSTGARGSAIRHLWKHTGETPFKCQLCPQGFRDKRRLAAHVMTHNSPVGDREKSRSSKVAANERILKTRLDSSIKPISPKKFYKKPEILANISTNDESEATEGVDGEDKEWKCDFMSCTRSYSAKANLKRHQKEIHKKLSKPLFFGNKNLGKDVKFFIPKTPKIAENSPKKRRTAQKPEQNSKSTPPQHKGTTEKGFTCNYKNCQHSYQTSSGLFKHKKRVHNFTDTAQNKTIESRPTAQISAKKIERNFTCPESGCGSRFVWAKNLRTHMKEKHNISKMPEVVPDNQTEEEAADKLQCPYPDCPHTASSRHTQRIHYKTHFSSEDKPFKCLISGCDYSTQKLSLLKYHVLNRHSEQQFFRAMEETGVHYPSWYR